MGRCPDHGGIRATVVWEGHWRAGGVISVAAWWPWRQAGQVTVRRLMNRSFKALLALIFVMGLAGLMASGRAFVLVSRPLNQVIDVRRTHAVARAVLTGAQADVDGYLLTGGDGYRASYERLKAQYPAAMAALRAAAVGESVSREIDELDRQAARWWLLADRQVARTPGQPPSNPEIDMLRAQLGREVTASRAIDAALSARVSKLNHRNDVLNTAALIGLVSTIVLGVLLGTWIARSATRRITEPLAQVVQVLARLGRGERDARVTLTAAPVEIDTVAAALNAAADETAAELAMFAAFPQRTAAVRQHLCLSRRMGRSAGMR